jgi:uncharacterized protein (DUF885 family)
METALNRTKLSYSWRYRAFICVLLAAVAFTLLAAPLPAGEPMIDDFFRDFTDEWVRGNPNLATSTRYFVGEEQDRLERQLTPVSFAYQRQRIQLARRGLAELKKFNRSGMTDTQRLSAQLLEWQLDTIVQGEAYLDFAFPLEQFNGVNVNLPNTLVVNHPLLTEKDADNYLARLAEVAPRMEEAIADAKGLIAKNMLPPTFILQATARQMGEFVSTPPAQNPLVATYADRIAQISAIPAARREELRARAERIVATDVYPVWQAAIAMLQPLLSRTNADAGLWRFKNGAAAYSFALRRFTTTSMTPEEIHQAGLRQVDKLEKEMDALFRQLGRSQGSVKERIDQLQKDLAYPLTEDGRKAIMSDVETMLRDAERRSTSSFDRRPMAPVVAQPFPRFREASAAASYTSPSPDGSRPGIFQIPLRPERMTRFALRTLVYHETVPGHHFQIALELENAANPRFRRIRAFGGISALAEGWALYAERFAAEAGWYENDIEGRLGQLDAELFRARRLVVDTGIHSKRWTRQQAIDYGIEASEVERYVVNPGQACSYMVGELKLLEFRDKARKTLGDKFSMAEFHNTVLASGTLPLELLEREVNAYLKRARGKQ